MGRFKRPTGGLRAAALCVALVGASLLAGCGDDDGGAPIAFDRNQRQYRLPLDQFGPRDIGASDYASNLLVQRCMRKQGYEWPIPAFDPHAPNSATWNAIGRRLFDVEIAAAYGYHLAPSNQPDPAQALALNARKLSPGEQAASEGCFTSVRKRLPPPQEDLPSSLATAAYEAAKADEDTVAAAQRWRECMRPVGISDLPDAPSRMPSPSLGRRFHLDTGGHTATAAEIRIATADARCRESSGYAKQIYATEVERQLELVSQNREALERVRATNAQLDRRVQATIANSAG